MTSPPSERDDGLESALSVLRAQPVPDPSPGLLARILTTRALGTRVVLPVVDRRGPARGLRYAAAAAIVLGMGWLGANALIIRTERRHGPLAHSVPSVLDGTPFLPSTMFSQESRPAVRSPRYPQISVLEPGRLRAGRWTYETRWITDRVFISVREQRTITLAALNYQETPAWLATEERGDTLLVDQGSLRPLRYVRPMRRSTLVQQFSRDSVFEDFRATLPTERYVHTEAALPGTNRSPLLVSWTGYSLEAVVQALPLERDWRGSLYSVGWHTARDRFPTFTALDLRVTGTERITVPAGTFDCWKLEVREGDDRAIVWVSKQQRWVVMRSHTVSDDSGEWRTEVRLFAVDTTSRAPGAVKSASTRPGQD